MIELARRASRHVSVERHDDCYQITMLFDPPQ